MTYWVLVVLAAVNIFLTFDSDLPASARIFFLIGACGFALAAVARLLSSSYPSDDVDNELP